MAVAGGVSPRWGPGPTPSPLSPWSRAAATAGSARGGGGAGGDLGGRLAFRLAVLGLTPGY